MSDYIGVIVAVAGLLLSALTFYVGRITSSKSDGKSSGILETDLKYIKEAVSRIEAQLNKDVQRLEGRIDELSNQMMSISNTATKSHASAKAAHRRVDEHLEREHQLKVDKSRYEE